LRAISHPEPDILKIYAEQVNWFFSLHGTFIPFLWPACGYFYSIAAIIPTAAQMCFNTLEIERFSCIHCGEDSNRHGTRRPFAGLQFTFCRHPTANPANPLNCLLLAATENSIF
jgi:hypothetical protein